MKINDCVLYFLLLYVRIWLVDRSVCPWTISSPLGGLSPDSVIAAVCQDHTQSVFMYNIKQWSRIECGGFPVEEQAGCEARFSHCFLRNSPSPAALTERQRVRAVGTGFSTSESVFSDKLIYTLKHGWAAMCHGGLSGCRFLYSSTLCWRVSLISSSTGADSVLIADISCYMAFDCYNNPETTLQRCI